MVQQLRDLSIRWKIALIIFLSAAMALSMLGIGFSRHYEKESQRKLEADSIEIGDMVAANCASALVFDDQESAVATLQSLQARSSIRSASLFKKGSFFADYAPEKNTCRDLMPLPVGYHYQRGRLLICSPVVWDGQREGSLLIEVSLEPLQQELRRFTERLLGIGAAAMLVALLLAFFLQRLVSQPIRDLEQLASKVAGNEDYSLRAKALGKDETGHLVNSFNTMLGEIEKRDTALRAGIQHIHAIIEAMPDRLFVIEPEKDRVTQLGEQPADEPIDGIDCAAFQEFYSGANGGELRKAARDTIQGKPARVLSFQIGEEDDSPVYEVRLALFNPAGEGQPAQAVCLVSDISERQQLEEQLRQAEKMQAIGQLAGGVAHDFNNQLTVITGYCEVLPGFLKDPIAREYLEKVKSAAHHSANLTRQLLAYSRKGSYRNELVDAHEIIREVTTVLKRSVDKRIQVHAHLGATSAVLRCDPSHLQNALLNLGINGRDAIDGSGELIFSTDEWSVSEEMSIGMDFRLRSGRYLRICVRDSGCGIASDLQERIFEPFFTTKAPGVGTGMGLAGVFGTVKRLNGGIELESTQGEGTTFKLYLPLEERRQTLNIGKAPQAPQRVEARVLVVDDEEAVGQAIGRIMEGAGCTVTLKHSSREACAFYTSRWREFDLVLLDLMMPDLSGVEVLHWFREINPKVPVLLVSGYTDHEGFEELLQLEQTEFITKPFAAADLLHLASRLVEEAESLPEEANY